MAVEQIGSVGGPAVLAPPRHGRLAGRSWADVRRLPLFPLAVLAAFAVMALFGPWLAPLDADETDLLARLAPPAWADGGRPGHLLGTDRLGRDVLSRIIVGARPSFVVAVVTIAVGGVLGTLIGLCAGYFGGKVEAVVMRLADSAISFPLILLA